MLRSQGPKQEGLVLIAIFIPRDSWVKAPQKALNWSVPWAHSLWVPCLCGGT